VEASNSCAITLIFGSSSFIAFLLVFFFLFAHFHLFCVLVFIAFPPFSVWLFIALRFFTLILSLFFGSCGFHL
jgi:hypothetical protein